MKRTLLLHKGYLPIGDAARLYGSVAKELNLKQYSNFEVKGLYYNKSGSTPAAMKREWISVEQSILNQYDYLIITDADYFKLITKQSKADSCLGNIYSSELLSAKILYAPTHYQAKYDEPAYLDKIKTVFNTIISDCTGSYQEIGSNIIHSVQYPTDLVQIKQALWNLHQHPALTMDIEAKSLKVTEAGIYTIAFAWNKNNGLAFPVDAHPDSFEIRKLLKEFLTNYRGKLIVHKANYDIMVLVYELFMEKNFTNLNQQVLGIKTLCRNLEDTLLITYLATNTCAGNVLGLKQLAQPFAGDWAVDVSDVTKVPLQDLLQYNLVDCLSTWFVYETYYPKMLSDEQESVYRDHFLPYLQDCIRMQLNGLPVSLEKVLELETQLNQEKEQILQTIHSSSYVKNTEMIIAGRLAAKKNSEYKKKRVTALEVLEPFNPSSNQAIECLVYEVMGLPVIETTNTGRVAVGKDILATLVNHTEDQEKKDILIALVQYSEVNKILSAFIPAFKNASVDNFGNIRLTGYFNLGGTVSGRMSSSNINLQQLPATGSRFAKPVKKCFVSNTNFIMCGIDFASLEDRIDALKTKDTNKLKVYIDGYDGHSLRAYAYFKDHMPDIIDTVESINSIAKKYKDWRQKSKAPSFALTYGGTYLTLMKNCGFDEVTAKQIEERYHELYKESDIWIKERIKEATVNGYVTGAFGLRVRTPMLLGADINKLTNQQAAESRTAGNALGQGWGLLNNRAMNAVLKRIDKAGLTEDIYPIAAIHDACYYMVRNDIQTILWLNQAVTEEAKWQDHPVIQHDQVGLEGQLDLFFPDWSNPITLPEKLTEPELISLVQKSMET